MANCWPSGLAVGTWPRTLSGRVPDACTPGRRSTEAKKKFSAAGPLSRRVLGALTVLGQAADDVDGRSEFFFGAHRVHVPARDTLRPARRRARRWIKCSSSQLPIAPLSWSWSTVQNKRRRLAPLISHVISTQSWSRDTQRGGTDGLRPVPPELAACFVYVFCSIVFLRVHFFCSVCRLICISLKIRLDGVSAPRRGW